MTRRDIEKTVREKQSNNREYLSDHCALATGTSISFSSLRAIAAAKSS